jgi:hypothetical protein
VGCSRHAGRRRSDRAHLRVFVAQQPAWRLTLQRVVGPGEALPG